MFSIFLFCSENYKILKNPVEFQDIQTLWYHVTVTKNNFNTYMAR